MSQDWVLIVIGILLIRTAIVVDSHEGFSRHSHRPGSPPHPPSSAGRHFPTPPPPTRLSPPPSITTAPTPYGTSRPRPTNGSSLSQRKSSSTIVVHHEDSPDKDASTIVILIFISVLIALIIILAIPASKYLFNKLGWFGADERGDTVPSGSAGRRRSSLEIPTSDESSNEEELATKEVTAISGQKSKRKGSGRCRSDQGEDREVIYHSHQDRVRGGRDATQQHATAAPHLHGAAYMHGASFGRSQARGRQSKETPGVVHQQHRSRTGCSAGHDFERPEATYQMQDYDGGLEEMSREVHEAMIETEATVTISQQQSQSKGGASTGDEIRMWMKHEVERRKEGAREKRADRQQQNSRTPPQALGPLNGAAPSIEEVISGAIPAPVAVNVDGRRLSWSGRSPAARSLNTSTMSSDERGHSSASEQPTSSRPLSTKDNTTATNHEDYFSTGAEGESYQMVRRRSSTATAVSIVETGGIEVLNIAGAAGPDASDSGTAGLHLPSDRAAATNRRRGSASLVIETSGLENAQESPLRRRFENQLPNNSLGDVEFRNDPLK